MRIAILGAGGVGSYYGGMLARAGHRVSMLARGAHLAAFRGRNLESRTPDGVFFVAVAATDLVTELGAPDLAIVAVKGYSLGDILPAARHLAGNGATVLALLNGVEAVDRLAAGGVARDHLLGGITHISAVRTGPGVVERRSEIRRITLAEIDGRRSERVGRVASRASGGRPAWRPPFTTRPWRRSPRLQGG